MEAETLALAQEIDFSFWALFARATFTVKAVILMLIAASFWSWSVIFQRLWVFRLARGEAKRFDRAFWSGEPLDGLLKSWGLNPKAARKRYSRLG